jgi:segregation and condensation protein A
MKALNITLAGDFLVMASTLLHIKSRMLLPGVEEGEEEDPRVELTRPLLEYLQLKEVAGELSERDLLDKDVFSRKLSPEYRANLLEGEEPVIKVNLFQLMDAFKRIVEENLPGASLSVQIEKWTIKDKVSAIMERLKEDGSIYFQDLFIGHKEVSEFIITFLALLELVHMGLITIFQSGPDKDSRLEGLFEQTQTEDKTP